MHLSKIDSKLGEYLHLLSDPAALINELQSKSPHLLV